MIISEVELAEALGKAIGKYSASWISELKFYISFIVTACTVWVSSRYFPNQFNKLARIRKFESDYLKIFSRISNHVEKARLLNINVTSSKKYLEVTLIYYKGTFSKEQMAYEAKRSLNKFFEDREKLSVEISMLQDCLVDLSHLVVQEFNFFKKNKKERDLFVKWAVSTKDGVDEVMSMIDIFKIKSISKDFSKFFNKFTGENLLEDSFYSVPMKLVETSEGSKVMTLEDLYGGRVSGHWLSPSSYELVLSKAFPESSDLLDRIKQLELNQQNMIQEKNFEPSFTVIDGDRKASGE